MVLKYSLIYFIGIIIVLIVTTAGFIVLNKLPLLESVSKRKSFFSIVALSSILYVIIFSAMKDFTALSHHSYVDFAGYLEIFNNFANGKGLFFSMQENFVPGTGNWLSVHFTPIAYVFGFLFKLFPSFHTINWAQTILLASSVMILYLFAKPKIGDFSAFCISLALLLNPTFQYITLYEFDFLRFIIPIGILTLGVVMQKDANVWTVLACCMAALLLREDAAFFVFGIGIYIFAFQKRKALGSGIMALSLIYLIVVLKIIMPSFRGDRGGMHVAAGSFSEFGSAPVEIIKNMLLHPIKLFIHLFHPYKSINYFMYLLPFSFMPIFGIKVLIVALPTAIVLAFSSAVSHSSYFLYYVSPILVAVTWACVEGISRVAGFLANTSSFLKFFSLGEHVTKERIAFAVLCGSIASAVYFGPSPLSIQFWNKDFTLAPFRTNTFNIIRYQPTSHDEIIRKVAKLIPENISVSAEQFLLQNVYKCKSIYVFPWIDGAEYIFIDKKNPIKTGGGGVPGSWDGLRQNPQFYYDWVEKHPDVFELVYDEDGVFLYKRKSDALPYPQPFEIPPGIDVTNAEMEHAKADYQKRINFKTK